MLRKFLFKTPSREADDLRIREILALFAPASRPASDRLIVERSHLFDPTWYQTRYPDVRGTDPIAHYLARGWREGRSPGPDFDASWYLARYADVADAKLNPLVHYLRHGEKEGRSRKPELPDDDRAVIERSGLFDPDWYRDRHKELGDADPLHHYLSGGWTDGRSPGPGFDAARYLSAYPDIANAGMNPLLHYLRHGRREGRRATAEGLTERDAKLIARSVGDFAKQDPLTIDAPPSLELVPLLPLGPPAGILDAWNRLFSQLDDAYETLVFAPAIPEAGIGWMLPANTSETRGLDLTKIAVVATDTPRQCAPPHPKYPKVIDLSFDAHDISHPDRVSLVETLIFAVGPASIVNVGSRVCWEVYCRRGQALADGASLYAAASSSGWGARRDGCPGAHLRECLPWLSRAYFDDRAVLRRWLDAAKMPEPLLPKVDVLDHRLGL